MLQVDRRPGEGELLATAGSVHDFSDELIDFGRTAGLIGHLDLVVTVDSAVAHLAGASGAPVWVLLPFAADFRLARARRDSPWYPTMRLFRQSAAGDWDSVVQDVLAELQDFERPCSAGAQN